MTENSMQIIDNLANIRFILFHTRKDEGQHMFAVDGDVRVQMKEKLDEKIYVNVGTASLYAVVHFSNTELNIEHIHSSLRGYIGNETRYDAQYATIDELTK